jgi:hypothetical protein
MPRDQVSVSLVRILSAPSPNLMLRSVAQAMCLRIRSGAGPPQEPEPFITLTVVAYLKTLQ